MVDWRWYETEIEEGWYAGIWACVPVTISRTDNRYNIEPKNPEDMPDLMSKLGGEGLILWKNDVSIPNEDIQVSGDK
jgi:hypothetical protein